MGRQLEEQVEIPKAEFAAYMLKHHSVYMQVDATTYYLTDTKDGYWRVQDTSQINEKGNFVDMTDLVATLDEFTHLPFIDEKSIADVYDEATFFPSEEFEDEANGLR